jgi:hypothetical protein
MATTTGAKEKKATKPRKKGYEAALAAAKKLTLEERSLLIRVIKESITEEVEALEEKLNAARTAAGIA